MKNAKLLPNVTDRWNWLSNVYPVDTINATYKFWSKIDGVWSSSSTPSLLIFSPTNPLNENNCFSVVLALGEVGCFSENKIIQNMVVYVWIFDLLLVFRFLLLVSPYIQSKFSICLTLTQRPCTWLLSYPIHCHAFLPQCHPATLQSIYLSLHSWLFAYFFMCDQPHLLQQKFLENFLSVFVTITILSL